MPRLLLHAHDPQSHQENVPAGDTEEERRGETELIPGVLVATSEIVLIF